MRIKGWKTILFNSAMVVLTGIKVMYPETVPVVEGVLLVAGAVGNIVLRFVTNTPVFKSS